MLRNFLYRQTIHLNLNSLVMCLFHYGFNCLKMFSFSSFVSFSISFRVITMGQDRQFKNFRIITLYFVKAIDSINMHQCRLMLKLDLYVHNLFFSLYYHFHNCSFFKMSLLFADFLLHPLTVCQN